MPRSLNSFLPLLTVLILASSATLLAQAPPSEQLQVAPPQMRRVEPPNPSWTADQLEQKGDLLRVEKAYLDALDYFTAALPKAGNKALLLNKIGITNLQLQRYKDARKYFEKATKQDKTYADAYNNIGVIYYIEKKYGKAVKQYDKALKLREDSASFHSNLATAYFSKKEFENAMAEYSRALQLDPDIFERTSQTGVAAQMSSPEDRAHYDYMVAKMYARLGISDRSLEYLRKAMEEGYKDINKVYEDTEFATLRKDPRFTQLMASRPPAIPE
jgi:tetratricopeptide (TPR) repeat protein